ncbi:hypothetical protein N9M16_07125 [Candidatus Dependentiae bacterium]|nr:hypothetical protein [Candidatus Dependentiae bacterium]
MTARKSLSDARWARPPRRPRAAGARCAGQCRLSSSRVQAELIFTLFFASRSNALAATELPFSTRHKPRAAAKASTLKPLRGVRRDEPCPRLEVIAEARKGHVGANLGEFILILVWAI